MNPLNRFIKTQENEYSKALAEIKSGKKRSHWMWYIFPQIKGLGFSETSKYYAIENIEEARQYLNHPILGQRLREITEALLSLKKNDAHSILGSPDDLKLHSCMTLFAQIDESEGYLFQKALDTFFSGKPDAQTLVLIR